METLKFGHLTTLDKNNMLKAHRASKVIKVSNNFNWRESYTKMLLANGIPLESANRFFDSKGREV